MEASAKEHLVSEEKTTKIKSRVLYLLGSKPESSKG